MQLSAEALMEILQSLRSDPARGPETTGYTGGMRRRQLPRVGVRLQLVILPVNATRASPPEDEAPRRVPVIIRLRSLSPRGLGFIHNERLVIGQQFLVILPRERGGLAHLLGRVERCREIDSGVFDIGSSIRMDVPTDEMNKYLAAAKRCA